MCKDFRLQTETLCAKINVQSVSAIAMYHIDLNTTITEDEYNQLVIAIASFTIPAFHRNIQSVAFVV